MDTERAARPRDPREAAPPGSRARAARALLAPRRTREGDTAEPLRWTRLGIGMIAAGYAAVSIHGALRGIDRRAETLTTLATAVAFVLSLSRPRLASALAIVTVWLEVSTGILSTSHTRTSGVLVYPALATAAGFLLGGRVALALAACSVATLAVDTTLDGAWGPGAEGDNTHWVLVASVLTFGGALLSRAVRSSYAAVLGRSEQARLRYADLFASAPDGLVAVDAGGAIVEANAAAAALLGATAAALQGVPIRAALRSAGASGDVDLAAASSPGAPLSIALERAGGPLALELSARAEPGPAGHAIVVLRDVTQRRIIEERLGHAQRLEMVGQLAGAVAHDFRNVIQAVSTSAALLEEHADPGVRELASEIVDAGRHGDALTRQLLAFARRDVRRPEPLDAGEVAAGMERLLRRVLGPSHPLALERGGAVPILADRAQLEQVILNLAANARDAMPGGGRVAVAIRLVDAAPAAALGSTLPAARQALVEVTDGGVGMSPEVRARIFEPFFSTKPRGQGTGLGLATVHAIVEESGGRIAVESAPGRGSVFRVFLPAADAPAAVLA